MMNKQEADIEADQRDRVQEDKWCPLSGQFCRKECVAYVNAKVEGGPGYLTGYRVNDGYCTAYSLIGP